jgi:hypothetical protein
MCARSCRTSTPSRFDAADDVVEAFSKVGVDGGDNDVSRDTARCVLRDEAALSLPVAGEKASSGDLAPAVARKI